MPIRLVVLLTLGVAVAACAAFPTLTPTPNVPASATSAVRSAPQISADRASEIDMYLSRLSTAGTFSGAILVSTKEGVLLTRGYGMADLHSSIPNTPHTRFLIGSMDKQFAAMAVLLLQSRGELNVAEKACDHIARCPAGWQSITIHQLLTHTSGLRDLPPDIAILTGGKDEPLPRSDLISLLQDDPLLFAPGERFSYSSLGYIVLEQIVEQVAGEPYGAFLEHSTLRPLGMLDTGFACDPTSLAAGQTAPGVRARLVNWPSAYTMCSSAKDLHLWDQALYTQQLLPSTELKAMFAPYVAAPSFGDVEYGYGWFIGEVAAHQVVGHAGWIPGGGFRGLIQRYPKDHVAIILLCNLESCDVSGIATSIAGLLFKNEPPQS